MPFRTRSIIRETATAIAVLALYVLVLLAPLHQAAGLQRDFDSLGYASLDLWSVCAPLTVDQTDEQPQVAKCPVAGLGKHDIALIEPASLDVGYLRLQTKTFYPSVVEQRQSSTAPHIGQARAPPVMV
ncbi:hypothetical protein [Devosia riboflavina]